MRRTIALCVAAAVAWASLVAPPAVALTTTLSLGVLTVQGTPASESIVVGCRSGSVLVNGSSAFGFGNVPCGSIVKIVLIGRGGDDSLDTSVSGGDFTVLKRTVSEGGAGRDHLVAGPFRDALYGEDGDDRMRGGDGRDVLTGDAGDDRSVGGAGMDVALENIQTSATITDTSMVASTSRVGARTTSCGKGQGRTTCSAWLGTIC